MSVIDQQYCTENQLLLWYASNIKRVVIIQSGKRGIQKVDKFYDDVSRKVNYYHQQIPFIRKFGPNEINDILNKSMPATTNIGQLYSTGIGIGTKLYQFYLENKNEIKSNE